MPVNSDRIRSHCNVCKRETNQEVIHSEKRMSRNREEGIWEERRWETVKCAGCDTVSFRVIVLFSEDYNEDGQIIPTIHCFPKSEKDALATKPLLNAPRAIRTVYGEMIAAFNHGSLVLCAGGLRAIVEGICQAENITDGPVEIVGKNGLVRIKRFKNLGGKIEGMAEKGIITASQREILHEHRFLGNEALHELDTPARDELRLAIEILEHTLDQVYEMRPKVAELRSLKGKRRAKPNLP